MFPLYTWNTKTSLLLEIEVGAKSQICSLWFLLDIAFSTHFLEFGFAAHFMSTLTGSVLHPPHCNFLSRCGQILLARWMHQADPAGTCLPVCCFSRSAERGQLLGETFLLLLSPLLHLVVGNAIVWCRVGHAVLGFKVHLGLFRQCMREAITPGHTRGLLLFPFKIC